MGDEGLYVFCFVDDRVEIWVEGGVSINGFYDLLMIEVLCYIVG